LPLDRFVVRVAVPDDVWDARTVLDARALRATPAWQSIPAGVTSERLGREWYRTARTALLTVPSVIVPEESIVLIRAGHPDTRRIRARVVRPFRFDAVSRS
jgi:RES domain-containing protein